MKKILPAIPFIDRLLGQPKTNPGEKLRLTSLCLSLPVSGGTVLTHTLRGTMYFLPDGERVFDHAEELSREYFLVPESFSEVKTATEVRSVVRMLQDGPKEVTFYTIMTTTDCNARCFYCYELGRKRLPMTDETAKAVAAHVISHCGGKKVTFSWFGGEPLFHARAIDLITRELQKAGVSYTSRIVTNGYYLDKAMVEKAVSQYHTERIQVTLDGTRDVYNRVKAYQERPENAFGIVLENIGHALDAGIEVAIRLNLDRANATDLSELADELYERFGGRENLYVYSRLLGEFVSPVHAFPSPGEAAAVYALLQEKLARYGFLRKRYLARTLRANTCMADNDACEVVTPTGEIGRCEHFSETELTGSVFSEERDERAAASWKEVSDPTEECARCAAFAECNQLKKCDWNRHGCTETDRLVRLYTLKQRILNTYEAVKNGSFTEGESEDAFLFDER